MVAIAPSTIQKQKQIVTRGFFTTEQEATRNEVAATVYLLVIYGLVLGAMLRILPVVALLPFPILYSRCVLAVHEVMHVRSARRINPLLRLVAFVQSPLTLGYAELRDIHLRHHAHLGSNADPENYLIRARPLAGFAKSWFAIELDFIDYVRTRGYKAELAVGHLLRLLLLAGFVLVNLEVWLWYLLITRLAISPSEFFFNHMLHSEETRKVLPSPPESLIRVGSILIGADNVHALVYHDTHHDYPRVAAGKLHVVRDLVTRGED